MYDCISSMPKVHETFENMHRRRPIIDVAHLWFNDQHATLLRTWSRLLHDKEVDLSDVKPYLFRFKDFRCIFNSFSQKGKKRALKWQKLANFSIVQVFLYRKRLYD